MCVNSTIVQNGTPHKPNVPSGYLLYAVFLPIIGLFLERYADSAVAAIILWVLVVVLIPVCCALDKRALEKHGVNTASLGNTFIFAPVYIYKRQSLIDGESMLCVAFVTLLVGAALTNGFVKGLRLDVQSVDQMIQNTAVTQLDNFSGTSIYTISQCVQGYSQSEVSWSTTKQSYGFQTIVSGSHDSKEFSITIELEFDGFTYQGFKIAAVSVDGKELDKDGKKDFLNECFVEYEEPDGSSSQSDSKTE